MEWLKTLAPTIATALGGPLAGMAVAALSKALAIDPEKVTDVIKAGKLNADQVASIQLAELELKAQESKMGLDFEALAVQDRGSARNMQMVAPSMIPALLSVLITAGFFGILFMLMTGKVATSDALMIMLGALGTAWASIIAFYFGSSASSRNKDALLYNSTPTLTK